MSAGTSLLTVRDFLEELCRDDDADLSGILFELFAFDCKAVDIRRGKGDVLPLDLELAAREDRTAVTLLLTQTGKCRFFDKTRKSTVFNSKVQCSVHTVKYRKVTDLHCPQGEAGSA